MEEELFDLLKRETQSRGWNVSRFAEACDADIALASRWMAENPTRRVVPSPRSCEKIADALGLDTDYILVLAGHRKERIERDFNPRLAGFLADIEAGWNVMDEAQRQIAERGARALFSVPASARDSRDDQSQNSRRQDQTARQLKDQARRGRSPNSRGTLRHLLHAVQVTVFPPIRPLASTETAVSLHSASL